jgi:ankyrin repeat protein
MLGRALAASLLGAYAGSKLSTRGITNRAAHKHVRRRRSSGHHVALTPKVPAPQISASPDAGLMTLPASPVAGYLAAAAGHVANEEDLDAALIKAALEGDEERVRMLVAGGADLNAKGRAQWTPLVAGEAPAASGGDNTGMADALFGEGAVSAGDADGQGWTALMTATIEGHVEVVRVLLELGAEVDVESKKGWTALRFAVSMDEAGILRLLLAAGADANVADGEGATALMQAARENSEESLKALLGAGWGRGADPLLKDSRRRTALTIAQGLGHTNIVRLLKEAEAKAAGESPAPAFTYRVIKVPRDQGYGSAARYNAIPVGAVLPQGWEETGREGNEEECLYYAWRSNVDVQTESGVWLGYGNQSSA